jgi:hypothetical protein
MRSFLKVMLKERLLAYFNANVTDYTNENPRVAALADNWIRSHTY